MSTGIFWQEGKIDNDPSDAERRVLDQFCDEYIIDFQKTAACLRMGYAKAFAETYAAQFMDKPYVQRRLAELAKAPAADPRIEEEETRRQLRLNLLREANYFGPGSSHAARVNALSKLASMYDMDAPKKSEINIHNRGGVMEVPGVSSIEAWQQEAQASQTELAKAADV